MTLSTAVVILCFVSVSAGSSHLEQLISLIPGRFDSGPAHQMDTAQPRLLSSVSKIQPNSWGLFQDSQAVFYEQHRHINTPTDSTASSSVAKQRVFELLWEWIPGSSLGAIRQRNWKLKTPSDFIDAPADRFNQLRSEDLESDGCEVWWSLEGDGFLASSPSSNCTASLMLKEVHQEYVSAHLSHTVIKLTRAPSFPPPIAPVMPTMFSANVNGYVVGQENETGTWHYDWPRNRLRNDYVITAGGQTFNMTQLWFADQDKFYVFQFGQCSYVSLGGLGLLRPDAFENAMKIDPNGSYYKGREFVDGQWTDHYFSGSDAGNFSLWTSLETNFPVIDSGPNQQGTIAANHWSGFVVGKVPESEFDMDISKCKPQTGLPESWAGRVPSLLLFRI